MKRLIWALCCVILLETTALPSDVYAKDRRVITQKEADEAIHNSDYYGEPKEPNRDDYDSIEEWKKAEDAWYEMHDEWADDEDNELRGMKWLYKKVLSYDGAYQENGLKIYAIMNGKTKTFKKTGAYSIITGGKKKGKGYGYVKFVAPSTGKYKIVLDTRNNILAGNQGITICPFSYTKSDFGYRPRVLYDSTNRNPNTGDIILSKKGRASQANNTAISSAWLRLYESELKYCTGWLRMKKGEYIEFQCIPERIVPEYGWTYAVSGVDITITKE